MDRCIHILGVRIDDVTTAEMLRLMAGFVQSGRPHQIVTVNIEYLMAAQRDPHFADVLRHSALNVPDSIGILWAARWLGHPLRERVTGSDGVYHIAGLCAQYKFRLFLLGAGPGIAERVAARLTALHPTLIVCGTHSGSPAPQEEEAIACRIRDTRADVLLVAYGQSPQEKWIARNQARSGAPVAVGVGGAFDFVAGVQKRAPTWMQHSGLEWSYRLLRQPWRWRRMSALPTAAWLVFWERFRGPRMIDRAR
jgi:N-acetylglucosaminyldiphosphoundecaprenol N-acetyl-beta-D-mannosaminyltransferase